MGNKESRRQKGTGSIYRHGAKFMARWVVDGKVYKRSTGETTERAALKRLEEFTAPFRMRTEQERIEAMRIKLAGVKAEIERYESEQHALTIEGTINAYRNSAKRHECSDETFERYERSFVHFRQWLAEKHPETMLLRDVTSQQASEYLASIRSRSPNTYNKRIVLFRSIWAVLADEAGINENPWREVAKRRLNTVRKRALSIDELRSLLATTSDETHTLFMIGICTGLRLSDCVGLQWSAVRFAEGFITVVPNKTARTSHAMVEIPLLPELRAELQSLPGYTLGRGPILPTLNAAFHHSDASFHRTILAPAFAKAGIASTVGLGRRRDVGFHSLRHTFVTICALHGVPLNIVQSIVGHTTIQMTEYYAHTNRATVTREVSRAFGGLLDTSQLMSGQSVEHKQSRALSDVLKAVEKLSMQERAELANYLSSIATCTT